MNHLRHARGGWILVFLCAADEGQAWTKPPQLGDDGAQHADIAAASKEASMNGTERSMMFWLLAAVWLLIGAVASGAAQTVSKEEGACRALRNIPSLTILSAELVEAKGSTPQYCHVTGLISPAIHWHAQLPLPSSWNGRLLNVGNGGKAGNLVYADGRVAQGYAVANSNTGHDNGSEPGASFAFNNRQAEIDFGYRAVHLTANASKTLVRAYYGKPHQFAYFEGCSTGGRQGMMEAQRFPYDFDGIVAGAPVLNYQCVNIAHVVTLQKIFKDNMAGNLAYDIAGDGSFASLTKLKMLQNAVLAKCDAKDGIKDGVIDDPLQCDFKPEVDLASHFCPEDVNAEECFTRPQVETISHIYSGPRDSKGSPIRKGNLICRGMALGSEYTWASDVIAHGGNKLSPSLLGTGADHVNFLFYENDPGVPPPQVKDPSYRLDKKAPFPEFAWWEFNIDDAAAGKGDFMMRITDATDPDLSRYLKNKKGKLLIWDGWGDSEPMILVDYYKEMVATTFNGDWTAAGDKVRLFLAPGMGHCGGGPGPNEWDKLAPLVEWVEKGKAPDYIVAVHRSDRRGDTSNLPVDNERKLCPFPQHAVYVGPAGGQNNRSNWVEKNFACR
ncbi:MAG: tannase/feruloyl esterase family alpha/beta hydrolase [Acidobacteria bacterium]|nr:tannase/feruloyl esterase family alpha/beta hydrolase [Acidobacteriota bacterium]